MSQISAHEEIKIPEGISTFVLLVLMLLSVTGSVVAADWTDGLGVLAWSAFAGVACGFALARTRLRGWLAHLVMLLLAAPVTGLIVGLLLPRALTLEEKYIVLQERVLVWTYKVIAGGTSSDGLIFVIQLALLVWVMAYFAAWYIYRRHQVWGAILPAGAAITLNLFYSAPQSGLYFGLFVTSALLLIVRLNLHAMERVWRRESIGYAPDISFDFLTYGVAFSLLLIMLAWVVPPTAPGPSWLALLDPLQGPWQGVEEEFSRVFSALRGGVRQSPTSFYGTTLSMGGPVKLGQRSVMDVQTNYGRYWRAAVYDRYISVGWMNTHLDAVTLNANDSRLVTLAGSLRVEVTQTVKVYLPDQNLLVAAAQPLRFSVPTEIRFAQPPESEPDAALMDVALVRARKMIREGDTYTAVSAISVADEKSLRRDSVDYSRWISATYLQLPDDMPARVRALAQTITISYTNPYDKAAALETYLRRRIRYNENVSAPPPNRDAVDYLLFERPEGYCNYYASAMAVLARALGIPARVASGYSLGEYHDGAFHVVESNAHSWPELYFPAYGWIEFEPTASQPLIDRPVYPDSESAPNLDENLLSRRRFNRGDFEEEDRGQYGESRANPGGFELPGPGVLVLIGGGLAGLLALGALGVMWLRRARWLAQLAPAARVYETMLNRARWLGVREQTYATPLERARALGNAMPDARAAAERVAEFYTRERYAAQQLDAHDCAALGVAWNAIRAQWLGAFTARVGARVRAPFVAMRTRFDARKTDNQDDG
ncbi:MAG: transglutaminase domain-containing protein [Chloroflexi bacterium]|nr:transglutaminase domain-containing protein [Chloroflexota bacterium]